MITAFRECINELKSTRVILIMHAMRRDFQKHTCSATLVVKRKRRSLNVVYTYQNLHVPGKALNVHKTPISP